MRTLIVTFLLLATIFANGEAIAGQLPKGLPKGLVYLSKAAPKIAQDMRYAGSNNFTGKPVIGYNAAECILGAKTVAALVKVNTELGQHGYALQVLDCYRPVRAVKSFVRWVSGSNKKSTKYHPNISRSQLIAKGYIGPKSTHSSGASVDLTLLKLNDGIKTEADMGTKFDFFDPTSHTNAPDINAIAKSNRNRLVKAMTKHGFKNYHREWWHFSYGAEPLRKRRFDFVVE